jgi:hypothetical protein
MADGLDFRPSRRAHHNRSPDLDSESAPRMRYVGRCSRCTNMAKPTQWSLIVGMITAVTSAPKAAHESSSFELTQQPVRSICY